MLFQYYLIFVGVRDDAGGAGSTTVRQNKCYANFEQVFPKVVKRIAKFLLIWKGSEFKALNCDVQCFRLEDRWNWVIHFSYQHCLKLYLLVGYHSNSAISGKIKGLPKGFKILYFDFCVLQIHAFLDYNLVSHLWTSAISKFLNLKLNVWRDEIYCCIWLEAWSFAEFKVWTVSHWWELLFLLVSQFLNCPSLN